VSGTNSIEFELEGHCTQLAMEPPAPATVRLALVGFGNVNTALLRIELTKRDVIARDCGVRLVVVGVCDSKGGRVDATGASASGDQLHDQQRGFDTKDLLEHKKAGNPVSTFPVGVACDGAVEMLQALGGDGYDILVSLM
jgi:homoserine dehydrogenase